MKRIVLALAPVILLSGCLASAPPHGSAETCPASAYSGLVGQPASAADAIPYGPRRSYVEGHTPMTTDHNPERLNIVIGPDGLILRVTCG